MCCRQKLLMISRDKKLLSTEISTRKKLLNDINEKEIVGIFYKKELQKAIPKEFRFEKVIKKKDNQSDVAQIEWKGNK